MYFSFSDPGDAYYKIYDGYRSIIELAFYIANKNRFLLYPDWYTVFDNNYKNAPNVWGKKIKEVIKNCEKAKADYALIYKSNSRKIESHWLKKFQIVAEFDWNEQKEISNDPFVWRNNNGPPKWILLRIQ